MPKERKVPFNLNLAPSIKNYIEKQAEGFGMSSSAFVTLVINQYRQQTEVMVEMANMKQYLEQLKELVDKNQGK